MKCKPINDALARSTNIADFCHDQPHRLHDTFLGLDYVPN